MQTRDMIRYILLNAGVGVAFGWLLVGVAIAFDVAGLGSLKGSTDVGALAVIMLMFVAGTTFGMIQMGIAIMAAGGRDQHSTLGFLVTRLAVGRPKSV